METAQPAGIADLILGSRWVPGGQTPGWPTGRKLVSRAGSTYARLALGLRLHDITGGYRVFRRAALAGLHYGDVISRGYCFQVEMAWRAVRAGCRIVEVPITFVDRQAGASKMSGRIVREAFWRVGGWGLRHRGRQIRGLLARRRHPLPRRTDLPTPA